MELGILECFGDTSTVHLEPQGHRVIDGSFKLRICCDLGGSPTAQKSSDDGYIE